MSISDRLDEIEVRRAQANSSLNGRHMLVGKDVPEMLAALRAVLDVCEKSELGMYPEPRYDEYIPGQLDTAERIRNAINAALGEEA